ncbi:MAG: hemagglutinin [Caldilineaceae bacterium]|nr:hemagglutinin [Caldilineaceae bacterium]
MSYEREVRAIGTEAQRRINSGQSMDEVAKWAHSARRSLGVTYKNLTPSDQLEIIYQRNLVKYGDKLGPTIDYLRNRQGKSWEEIIESASRPGGRDLLGQIFGFLWGGN